MVAAADHTGPGNTGDVASFRLRALEEKLKGIEIHFDQRFDKIEQRFDSRFSALAYVSREVYDNDKKSQDERIDSARALAMWALGALVGLVGLMAVVLAALKG